MNFTPHPENFNNGWSEAQLNKALKMREIWQDSLRHENNQIRAILQHAWFPHFFAIQDFLGNSKSGYELESTIFISDKTRLVPPSQIMLKRPTETWVNVTFYWVPEITDDELNPEEFEIIPVEFSKKQEAYIYCKLREFSAEINLPVNIVYE